jgi:hypothetical protein
MWPDHALALFMDENTQQGPAGFGGALLGEAAPKAGQFRQRGGRVCAGNPGRVSCTMMIHIFQNFLKF